MLCRLSDLRDKEVVNINNGSCMGCVSDVEIDTCCAKVTVLVKYCPPPGAASCRRKDSILDRLFG